MSIQLQIATASTLRTALSATPVTEYTDLLKSFDVKSKNVEYYLQVGEINKPQGWILHLSVVLSQVADLLYTIVPHLIQEHIPFKIVTNLATAEDLLAGNLGVAQIGKIISIYPENDVQALDLAKKLVNLTTQFKGPAIPSDICLGNIVYTRYGSFNPVIRPDEKGGEQKFIYDSIGNLVPDLYSIPFQFPKGIMWPFSGLKEPSLPGPPKYFNRIYKVIDILKSDCRGSVFQGLYLKSLFTVKQCVLKQGFTNADSDIAGRDIGDKLAWQAELYQELSNTIPMAELYNFIREDAYSLLVMQYINGDSLYQKAHDLNPACKAWPDLSSEESIALVNYGIELSQIISRIHRKGFVHRDIMPVNFLIDKKNRMFAIDLELAYSLPHKKPNPPFKLGTPGFASPEQMQTLSPGIEQDVYSLGATLLWLFTGLTPIKFNAQETSVLYKNLNFFILDQELTSAIVSCMSTNPEDRPAITTIISALKHYQQRLSQAEKQKIGLPMSRFGGQPLKTTICEALDGLNTSAVVSTNDFWYSKKTTIENHTARKSKQYARYPGISEGMAGPLYLLARLHGAGINVDRCMPRFTKAWDYIEQNYLNRISELSPGLYNGAAGLAVALKEGIQNGLINTKISFYKGAIQTCLELSNPKLDLAYGIAGQGVAILQCNSLLAQQDAKRLLARIVDELLSRQQTNGLWHHSTILDMGQGNIGILWFLLEYLSFFPNTNTQIAVERGLNTILHSKTHVKSFYNLSGTRASYDLIDGGMGLILLSLKAFEIFKDDKFKKLVHKALLKYPPHVVHSNFSQQNGLAGLGEVYLEAWRVLQEEQWQQRSNWITAFFLHTFSRNTDGSGYWILEENNLPTADFLVGISGIIHYLARSLNPEKIKYRLLN